MAKKKKEKLSPEKKKNIAMIALIVIIVIASACLGLWLINKASVLGVFAFCLGFGVALFLFITNMNRMKVYEALTDMTKKSEEKASVKLDEDMEKCKGRIAALDERAKDRGQEPSA